jgi:integrase
LKNGTTVYRTTVDAGTDPKTGKRKQKLLTADTKGELEREAAKILADVARGTYFEPEKQTFGEYLSYWLETYKLNLGIRTYETYSMIIDVHLKPALGNIPLAKLLPAHIQQYYTEALANGRKDNKKTVGRGLTGCTVLKHHRLIREALHHAVKWELLLRNPAEAVQAPKRERVKIETLTRPEIDAMPRATKDTYLYMPTFLSSGTTMRLGEVLGLPWTDVNLKGEAYLSVTQTLKETKDGRLHFGPPKSKSSRRRIDLSPEVVVELKAHKKSQAAEKLAAGPAYQDHGLVCCLQDGRPIPPFNAGSYWRDVAKRVLGRDAHFHMLRHTAATMMLEQGEPIKRVSEMLGHASIALTGDTYGHVTPAGRKHAANTLGRAMFGAEE